MGKSKKVAGANLAGSMPSQDMDYQTDNHLRTLREAGDILSDPEKMGKVHKLAGRHDKALKGMLALSPHKEKGKIKSLADLRAKANAKNNEPDEDDMES